MKYLTALLLIAVTVLTGCPAKSIEKAEKSSKKLATYANAGIEITRSLHREDVITTAQKDKIADAFIVLADAGIAFDKAVANAKAAYAANPDQSIIDGLFATFDSTVVNQTLAVLQALKVVSNTEALKATIESLKTAVILIAKAFNKQQQVEARLAV